MNTTLLRWKEVLLATVVVLILIFAVRAISSTDTEDRAEVVPDTASSTAPTLTTATSTPTSSATTGSQAVPKPAAALTYTQAVNKYGVNRMQFDANCTVNPLQLVVKNGTTIMLDNRSGSTRSVYLDRAAYTLGAFNYKTATLSYAKSSLPKTVIVDCGTGRNSAKIIVQ